MTPGGKSCRHRGK